MMNIYRMPYSTVHCQFHMNYLTKVSYTRTKQGGQYEMEVSIISLSQPQSTTYYSTILGSQGYVKR